jgi:hypothetical protein
VVSVCVGGSVSWLTGPAAAEAAPSDAASDVVERTSWEGKIVTSSQLEVTNPFGDLRFRYGGPDRTVGVSAVLQQLDSDGSRLVLQVDDSSDPATISVVRAPGVGPRPAPAADATSRADIVVLVPSGFAVQARTDHGLLECSGLESDVDLETVSGPIRVRGTQGRVTAHSNRGSITVNLVAGATKKLQRITTVTGSIEVWATDSSNLDVTLATSGRLITDVSMQVEHRDREEPDKLASAIVGGGGARLELASLRGDLSLRRKIELEQLAVAVGPNTSKP